jgi:hypothetical protein
MTGMGSSPTMGTSAVGYGIGLQNAAVFTFDIECEPHVSPPAAAP